MKSSARSKSRSASAAVDAAVDSAVADAVDAALAAEENNESSIADEIDTAVEPESKQSPRDELVIGLFGYSHRIINLTLTLVLLFNYMSRSTISPTKTKMQNSLLEGDSTKGSSLSTSTMIGLAVFGPIFGTPIFSRYSPMTITALGLIIRCIGEALTSFAQSYAQLFCGFFLCGVGSGAIHAFSFVVVDIVSPPETRATWMGFLFSSLPIGGALGFGIHGVIVEKVGWRAPFIINAVLLGLFGIVFAALYWKGPPDMAALKPLEEFDLTQRNNSLSTEQIRQSDSDSNNSNNKSESTSHDSTAGEETNTQPRPSSIIHPTEQSFSFQSSIANFFGILKRQFMNPTWILLTLSNTCQTALIHIFTVNGTELVTKCYDIKEGTSGLLFGGCAVIAGLVGSFCGGKLLNTLRVKYIPISFPDYYSLKPATIMISILSFLGFMASMGLSMTILSNIKVFMAALLMCELIIFMMVSPMTSALLWSVIPQDRAFAYSLSNTVVNTVGCALSPIAYSSIMESKLNQDKTNYKESFSMATAVCGLYLLLCGMFALSARFTLPYLNKVLMVKWSDLDFNPLVQSGTKSKDKSIDDDIHTDSLQTSSDYTLQ